MENINTDILRLICSLINDKEFINLISSCTQLYNLRFCNLKHLINQYTLSNIGHVFNNYMFTDIFYDYLEWNPNLIPQTIEKITFIDEFNENIGELFTFKYIKHINLGIFYTNDNLLENNIDNFINRDDLIASIICNKIFVVDLKSDIDKLIDIKINREFPSNYNKSSMYSIRAKYIKKNGLVQAKKHGNNNNLLQWVNKFNSNINLPNNYKSMFYYDNLESLTQGHLDFYGNIIQKIRINIRKLRDKIFKKYNCNDLDDLLILMWGRERVERNKKENLERKKMRDERRNINH